MTHAAPRKKVRAPAALRWDRRLGPDCSIHVRSVVSTRLL